MTAGLPPLPNDLAQMPIAEVIKRARTLTKRQALFWVSAKGWAPVSAAGLLSKSRLDWQASLVSTLQLWVRSPPEELSSGELILAWANLGSLIEGELKLLLSVWYEDYKNDVDALKSAGAWHNKKNAHIEPDGLTLDVLRKYVSEKSLLIPESMALVALVQSRRNAIHAFKDRPIGDTQEFLLAVRAYLGLKRDIGSRLPYPDEMYEPREF